MRAIFMDAGAAPAAFKYCWDVTFLADGVQCRTTITTTNKLLDMKVINKMLRQRFGKVSNVQLLKDTNT